MRLLAIILILSASSAPASAHPFVNNCASMLLDRGDARTRVAKTYLMGNLSFPQSIPGVLGTLVAHYLTDDISYAEILSVLLEGKELEILGKAMVNAHNQHGIRPIHIGELEGFLETLLNQRLPTAIRNTLIFANPDLSKERFADVTAMERRFFEGAESAEAIHKLQEYGLSVMHALRSEAAKATSKDYRMKLSSTHVSRDRNLLAAQYNNTLKTIVVSHLLTVHPELAAIEGTLSRAEILWRAMSSHNPR